MALAEGVSARIAYKQYASGVITANAEAVSSSDLGASGGQSLRRVSSSLTLGKDTYQSDEIREDRQVYDFRHGVRRVSGSINGELSTGTYFDFIEAACRGTKASATALSDAGLTSAAASNSGSTFTFAAGDPVALGLRVGDVIRFTNMSVSANNSTNFLITGFSGTSNRVVAVYPAPTDQSADTAFNVTTVGKSVFVPSTGFVSRKFGIEEYHADLDIHRLFTECRIGGIKINLPATGMATIEIPVMGRDMETASGGSSPFFTAPAAATSTNIEAAVNGLIRVGGVNQGVITGANIDLNLNPSSDAVVGQTFVPEIFLGRAVVTGQLTAFFQDMTMINYFVNETEVEILLYLTGASGIAPSAFTVYMPRVKFGGGALPLQGEQGQTITLPFTALKLGTQALGMEATTIRFTDTDAA